MSRTGSHAVTRFAVAAIFVLGAVGSVAAQEHNVSVDGRWEITVESDQGSFAWNASFEQEGGTLTGFAEANGQVYPLEGSVQGDMIIFYVSVPDHEDPLAFEGVVDDRSASGSMDPAGGAHAGALMDWYAEKVDGGLTARVQTEVRT